MCLATVYKKQEEPDSILLQYVSKILVDGNHITLIDVMGEERQLTEPSRWWIWPTAK